MPRCAKKKGCGASLVVPIDITITKSPSNTATETHVIFFFPCLGAASPTDMYTIKMEEKVPAGHVYWGSFRGSFKGYLAVGAEADLNKALSAAGAPECTATAAKNASALISIVCAVDPTIVSRLQALVLEISGEPTVEPNVGTLGDLGLDSKKVEMLGAKLQDEYSICGLKVAELVSKNIAQIAKLVQDCTGKGSNKIVPNGAAPLAVSCTAYTVKAVVSIIKLQLAMPSIQWAPLRHWVVTFLSAADGGKDVGEEWKKKYVYTAADHRLVGPIREVSTKHNTLEIFDDEVSRGGPPLTLQDLSTSDLVVTSLSNIAIPASCVTNLVPKQLFSFVLECATKPLYKAMALSFKEVKKTYVVKGRQAEASMTALEVTSEKLDELQKAATEMLQQLDPRQLAVLTDEDEVTIRKQTEEEEEAAFLEICARKLKENENKVGFRVPEANSSIPANTSSGGTEDPAAESIADWIRLANALPNAPQPRPLTIFFVEGPADEDFAKAAMTHLKYDRKHLKILQYAKKVDPSVMILLFCKCHPSEQLNAVDFVVLEDCDLRLLSTKAKPFGMMHQVPLDQAGGKAPATYSHRWRFGRALENYMIPSLAPLALLKHKKGAEKAFELSVEAVCKISTMIFWNSWSTGLVAQPGGSTLISDFERELGNRMLKQNNPETPHFKQALHTFLCALEEEGANAEGTAQLVLGVLGASPPVLSDPGPLQELLQKAAKILSAQTQPVGTASHTALCRVLFQPQEAYVDLMANLQELRAFKQELHAFLSALEEEVAHVSDNESDEEEEQQLGDWGEEAVVPKHQHQDPTQGVVTQAQTHFAAVSELVQEIAQYLPTIRDVLALSRVNSTCCRTLGASSRTNSHMAAQRVLLAVGAPAVRPAEDSVDPGSLQVLLKKAANILFNQTEQGTTSSNTPHNALCQVLFQAQEAYVDLMANPSKGSNEKMSQDKKEEEKGGLFLCGHQTEGGGECGCRQLLLVGVALNKATRGICSCCGHKAAEHNKRFSIPNAATGNSEGFYAALCMSAVLLWDSHEYMKAIRGESRLGGGFKDPGTDKWTVHALQENAQRNQRYREHLWWLTSGEQIEPNALRKQEVNLLRNDKDSYRQYVPIDSDLGLEPIHVLALRKLCLLRELQRSEVNALFHRLHVDQSAATKKRLQEEEKKKKEEEEAKKTPPVDSSATKKDKKEKGGQ